MRPIWSVGISLGNRKLIIKPATKSNLTLKQLLAKIRKENLHPEVDTGLTAGNETW